MAQMQQSEQREKSARGGEQKSQEAQGGQGGQSGQSGQQQQGSSTAITRGAATSQGQSIQRRQREPFLPLPFLDPFNFVRRFMGDMDRIFDDFGMGRLASPAVSEPASGLLGQRGWSPQIEVFERGDKLVVRVDLPGLRREDVRVEVEGDNLVISGERRDEREEAREGVYHTERTYGSFRRVIQLLQEMDPEYVEASFENGVLEVQMKAPKPRGRQIEVKSMGSGQQGSTSGSASGSATGSASGASGNGGSASS